MYKWQKFRPLKEAFVSGAYCVYLPICIAMLLTDTLPSIIKVSQLSWSLEVCWNLQVQNISFPMFLSELSEYLIKDIHAYIEINCSLTSMINR